MSGSPDDALTAARNNLRDTAKWLIAALAAVVAGVVGTGSLAGLGQIESDTRFWIALAGAIVGLTCIQAALFIAVRLLVPKPFFIDDLVADSKGKLKKFVDDHQTDLLPPEYDTLTDLLKARAASMAKLKRMDESAAKETERVRFAKFQTSARAFMRPVNFEHERQRFVRSSLWLGGLSTVAIIALGAFAWAANPSASDGAKAAAPPAQSTAPPAHG